MKRKHISTAGLKLLIVFIYFFIFSATSLTAFTIASQNIPEFVSELMFHFACESQGIQPGRTCERGFNRMGDEVALILVYILLGFIPVVSLVYVINYQEIKKTFSKWCFSTSGVVDLPVTTSKAHA